MSSVLSKPEIVVFDLGKVLLDFDYGKAVARIGSKCSGTGWDLNALINQSPLLHEFESGRISSKEFFSRIRETTSFSGGESEFAGLFGDIFEEIPAMIEAQHRLESSGIKTYIFSNTNPLAIEFIRRNFPFFARFSGYVLSYEVGAMKPEPMIYEAVEQLTGKKGAQIVYLDDRAENIAGGAARGWKVHLHDRPADSLRFLEQHRLLESF